VSSLTPYFENETLTLYQGNALAVLETLPDGCCDALITDPPYMLGAKSTYDSKARCGNWADMENSAHWYAAWMKEGKRVLKPSGWLLSFCNWRSLPVFMLATVRAECPTHSLLVWDKDIMGAGMCLRPSYEFVLFMGMPEAVIANRRQKDIITCRWTYNRRKLHPVEKPVELLERLIALTTRPGDTVCDPFMGSGSTGKAALLLGRKFVGVEREPEYCAIAAGAMGVEA
jgi:site-specific DNA-methyltransferase (adenine-specific)